MATSWRLATSLETLRSQVNSAYPNRSKASDGTIGDTSHAASASDHNPNQYGVVCALDLTHQPGYFDTHAMAESIRRNPHPEAKYIISNGRIAGGFNNWQWQKYNGSNPHSSHVHISVGSGNDGRSKPPYDSTNKWNIGGNMADKTILTMLWAGYANQYPAPESYLNHWDGKPIGEVHEYLMNTDIRKELIRKANDYNRVVDIAEDRLKSIRNLQAAKTGELEVVINGSKYVKK